MKTTVIYHNADYDGIFCREIAKKFLGKEGVKYIGWNFGDPIIPFEVGKHIYILDLSPDCLDTVNNLPIALLQNITWVDHHKTSIEKWNQNIPGYRIDGVAACRLAWQWFSALKTQPEFGSIEWRNALPSKQDFIDRKVQEPLAIRLAGEYDIWDKRDPDAETFQYALRCLDSDTPLGPMLNEDYWTEKYLPWGRIAQTYDRNVNTSICKSLTWLMEWEGLKFLCVHHARFNSLLFAAKDVPETGHDALLGFKFDGKQWTVSLYHAKHRTDLDLSEIAKKYGGGGHKGACGFTCKTLPFSLYK